MEEILYHGSKVQNLKKLVPFEKLHKGGFVYAAPSREAALLFSANYHILKVAIYAKVLDDGKIKFGLRERLSNAFDDYKMPVSIYSVSALGFENFENAFGSELRCSKPVKIIHEEKIASAYDEMMRLEAEGKIFLQIFEKCVQQHKDNSDVVCTALFGYIETKDERYITDFNKFYPHLAGFVNKIFNYIKNLDEKSAIDFCTKIYDNKEMKFNHEYINSAIDNNLE